MTSNLHGTKKTKSSLLISSPQNTELHPQWRRFISGGSPPLAWCTMWILDATQISSISSIPSFIDDSFIISFSQFYSVNQISSTFHASNLRFLSHYLRFCTRTVRWRPPVCRCLLYVIIHQQVPRIAWGQKLQNWGLAWQGCRKNEFDAMPFGSFIHESCL